MPLTPAPKPRPPSTVRVLAPSRLNWSPTSAAEPLPTAMANMPRALERVVRTAGMPAAVLPADAVPGPVEKRESFGARRDSPGGA